MYALSGLTATLKYPDIARSIIEVWIGKLKPLKKFTIQEYQKTQREIARGTVSGASTAGDTTITLGTGEGYDFDSSGSVTIGEDTITYTAITTGTTLTGVPASGTGAITETNSNAPVWQGVSPERPYIYALAENNLYLEKPPSTDYENQYIKVRGFKKLTAITEVSDTTEIPFTNVFSTYLAAMIEYKNGNIDKAKTWMADFKEEVMNNALADRVSVADYYTYYNYYDSISGVGLTGLDDYFDDDKVIIY